MGRRIEEYFSNVEEKINSIESKITNLEITASEIFNKCSLNSDNIKNNNQHINNIEYSFNITKECAIKIKDD